MHLQLTEEIKDILAYAREEAMRLGNRTVSTDHLYLGIFRHKDNEACRLLTELHVVPHQFKQAIEAALGTGESISPDEADKLHLSKGAENAIKIMFIEARALQGKLPGAPHLLLALLRGSEGLAPGYLRERKITYTTLRAKLRALQHPSAQNPIKADIQADVQADIQADIQADVQADVPASPQERPGNASRSQSPQNAAAGAGNLEIGPDSPGGQEALRPKSKTPLLDSYGFDLTAAAAEGRLDPVACREEEIDRLAQILGRRKKNNPVLIGEPGVGKSAIVEGLALQIASRQTYPALLDKRLISLDLGSMVAGTKYRGQFEERIKGLLAELQKDPQIILFIDELHTLVGAGSSPGSLDAANMLKPGLARGEIQCIGATTLDEYRQHIEKDGALERRFQKVLVEPTDEAKTLAILRHLRPRYEAHHHVSYTDSALEACVRLSQRYITDRCQPDKAIDTLDEVGSRIHLASAALPQEVQDLKAALDPLREQKRRAVQACDFAQAARLRDQERETEARIRELMEAQGADEASRPQVDAEDVARTVSLMTQVPVSRVSATEGQRLSLMAQALKDKLVGQDSAIDGMVRAIRRNRAGLKDPNKPIGTFIFLGPTGVGKTHLAKLLAQYLFDSTDNLVRIDMSEYMEKYAVSRLIGAPPGYVGYEEGGQLTERVRRKPYSVVLLDEIEKAHPDIFNLLLQVFDEGRLTDSNGRHVDFRNTVLIMTSNIGSRDILDFGRGVGFASLSHPSGGDQHQALIQKALGRTFTPEFLNRVDEQIVFKALDKEEIYRIVDIELAGLVARLQEKGFVLELAPEAKDFIARTGFDARYGARPLKRAIQRHLEDPLSEAVLGALPVAGTRLVARLNAAGTEVEVSVLPPATEAAKPARKPRTRKAVAKKPLARKSEAKKPRKPIASKELAEA